ncbi:MULTISPECIES: FkbM family methyltransferase [unclassified Paraburkholderia]|uniref:FkbM family methyltransferase n=1 Tax=unclassified Paraburkholderia TaxID=2615204 RepID=UPI002AB1E205|nr:MULTISPECIES: FkbM family methyltransferase [unclassified Paraburkholderia]
MNHEAVLENTTVAGGAAARVDTKRMQIWERTYDIAGDKGYLAAKGDCFEPDTTATLRALSREHGAVALDVGANIGLTALALSQYCSKVIAVEPIPVTFDYLSKNIAARENVTSFNFALGSEEGTIKMQGSENFLAGAFVADAYTVNDGHHFTKEIPVRRLDDVARDIGINSLDLVKIDVEGFELEVLGGGRALLGDLKPIAYMEMNHWCLNMFRRLSIPEFRERILDVFPYLFAIDGPDYVDFTAPNAIHAICHAHILKNRFNNLVAGFDRHELVARLELRKKLVDERNATH